MKKDLYALDARAISELNKKLIDFKLLPERKLKFAQAYLSHFDGTRAAIEAGYSPKAAASASCRCLHDPNVKEYIEQNLSDYNEKYKQLKYRIIDFLTSVLAFDPTEYLDHTGKLKSNSNVMDGRLVTRILPRPWGAEYEFFPKYKAVELLMRHIGMITDKIDITSRGERVGENVNITFEVVDGSSKRIDIDSEEADVITD